VWKVLALKFLIIAAVGHQLSILPRRAVIETPRPGKGGSGAPMTGEVVVSLTLRRRNRVEALMPRTRLGQVRAQARRAADRLAPVASNTRDTATHWIEDARYWAAPRLEHAAHSVEEQLAPRVSGLLSEAAHRIDPAPSMARHRRRWPFFMLFTGIALGAAGYLMYRRNAQQWNEAMKETAAEAPRWAGNKAEQAANAVSQKADEVGRKAEESGRKAEAQAEEISRKMS
jgi:hypothetical protein